MQTKQLGFTLVELIVVLAVAAIGLFVALPNFKSTMSNNRALGVGDEFLGAVSLARTEAVRRGGLVTLCPSSDGSTCLGAGNWEKGWMMFADSATASSSTATVGTVLKVWNNLPDRLNMTAVTGGSTNLSFIRFTGSGALGSEYSSSRQVNIYVQGCKGVQQSQITLSVVGMASTSKVNCP